MENQKKRIPRNYARIEFLACLPMIRELISAGYDSKKIHVKLLETEKIRMSYRTFCLYTRRSFPKKEKDGEDVKGEHNPPSIERSISKPKTLVIGESNYKRVNKGNIDSSSLE